MFISFYLPLLAIALIFYSRYRGFTISQTDTPKEQIERNVVTILQICKWARESVSNLNSWVFWTQPSLTGQTIESILLLTISFQIGFYVLGLHFGNLALAYFWYTVVKMNPVSSAIYLVISDEISALFDMVVDKKLTDWVNSCL